jgi:hypothetical protein
MILLLALLAGSAAFVMTRNAVDTYEREAVFVLRPSDELDDAQIPDAVRGISQQDAQLVQTVSRVIETERFLRLAFVRGAARLPDDAYVLTSTITPGSDVISDWVSGVYRAYELELLEVTASDTPVSASPIQSIVLATLLGLLLGIGSVFAELKARERMGLVSAQLTSADQRAGGPPQGGPQRGSVRVYSGNADVTDVPRPTDAGTSPSVAQKKR